MRIPDREFRLQILKRVGAKLTELRGDLSQSELAKQAGVTRASISALEGGQQGISVETLCRLAASLDVSPAALLPDKEEISGLLESPRYKLPIRPLDEVVDDFLQEGGSHG
jgi:transcriptional regulator with XRE-family HTH domain